MLQEIRTIIREIYVQDVGKAFSVVNDILLRTSDRKTDFLLVKNQWVVLKDENSRGTISFENLQRKNNQITVAFFHFIDRLTEDDLNHSYATTLLRKNGVTVNEETAKRDGAVSFKKLSSSSKPEIYEMIELYKHHLNQGRLDDEIYFNLGLCYLHLKLFDLAIRYFQKCLELAPDQPDYHYYLSLAKIRNRRPFTLMPNDIREVETYLSSALELDPGDGKYIILSIVLKYDYYHLNGLNVRGPLIGELIESLANKKIDHYEIKRMQEVVPVADPKLIQFINQF